MKKILLVNPPKYKEIACMRDEGTCGVSGVLRNNAQMLFVHNAIKDKHHVDMIDMQVNDKRPDYGNYDWVIAWASIYGSFYEDIRVLKEAKERGCQTVVVVNRPIIEREIMQRFKFIDYFVRYHERERTIAELLDGKIPKGLIYRKGNKLVTTHKYPYLDMATQNVVPEWGLLPLDSYEEFFIILSRGCAYNCNFCEFRDFQFQHRKVNVILDELEYLSKFNVPFKFETNDLFLHKKFAKELLQGIIDRKIDIDFYACVRAQSVNNEMLTLAKKAGMLNRIELGVESPSNMIRDKLNKQLPTQEIKKAIDLIKKHNMKLELLLMWGLPWDNDRTATQTIDFIKTVSPYKTSVSSWRPVVGTPMYRECQELGLIKNLTLDDYVSKIGTYFFSGTLHLSKEETERWYEIINHTGEMIYFMKNPQEAVERFRIALINNPLDVPKKVWGRLKSIL